ncbi:MAG: DUF1273 family protein [Clostridia bacterium]|nr:DUF1273 family protein [Clostridia bacterium]
MMQEKKSEEKILSGKDFLTPRPKTAREREAALRRLTEEEKRRARCCVTGPEEGELQRPVDDLKVDLENEIVKAISCGYTTFIIGMTPGIELWAGCIVLRLRDRFPDLRLIAALPHPGFRAHARQTGWAEPYTRVIGAADFVQTISPDPLPESDRLRNRWMVDHSSKLIAVWDWRPSDTGDTVRYARKQGLKLQYIRA